MCYHTEFGRCTSKANLTGQKFTFTLHTEDYTCAIFTEHFDNFLSLHIYKIVWLGGVGVGLWTCDQQVTRSNPAVPLSSSTLGNTCASVTKQYNLVPALWLGSLQTQFGEHRCMQFWVIVVTDPQTHTNKCRPPVANMHTDMTDNNTLQR